MSLRRWVTWEGPDLLSYPRIPLALQSSFLSSRPPVEQVLPPGQVQLHVVCLPGPPGMHSPASFHAPRPTLFLLLHLFVSSEPFPSASKHAQVSALSFRIPSQVQRKRNQDGFYIYKNSQVNSIKEIQNNVMDSHFFPLGLGKKRFKKACFSKEMGNWLCSPTLAG